MAQPTSTAQASLSGGTSTRLDLVQRLARLIDDDAYTDRWVTGGNAAATTVDVASTTSPHEYEIGQVLDYLDDGTFEAQLITASPGTPNLTVRRGHRGTTAATHAANAIFRVSPDYLSHVLAQLVDEAVQRLFPTIPEVKVATYSVPASPVETLFALPADTEEVYKAYQQTTDDPVAMRPLSLGLPHWVDTSFAATGKLIEVDGLDINLTNFFVLYGSRPLVTTLTDAQEDVVIYDAARRALEIYSGHRRSRQGDPAIFDATSKIQLFRREAERIKEQEAVRLSQYLPKRKGLRYVGRLHYTEGL